MDAAVIWDAVLEKRAKRGLGSLSESEKTIYCLYRLAIGLEMEGLNVWLYDLSPTRSDSAWSELQETIRALDAAGKTQPAAVLGKVAEAVESVQRGPPASWASCSRSRPWAGS